MSTSLLVADKAARGKSARCVENVSQPANAMNSDIVKHLNGAYTRFCGLLTMAEEQAAAGDYAAAAGLAQIAARYTFAGYVGLFGSHRLEQLLLELGRQIPVSPSRSPRLRNGNQRNILHVLSYGRPVGGDARCAWRWIQEDSSNRHSVVITTQADVKGIYELPEVLKQSAEKTGGFLRTLTASTTNHLEQARELRMLCQEADIVVLHLFPYDIVPVLALAAGCDSAKTIYANHADHAFWVGAGVSHLIAHLRKQPPQFSEKRRGLEPERCSVLPIPMVYTPPTVTRNEAKQALGYSSDTVILLTIASPFKYSSPGRMGFLDLVAPVMAQFPKTVLIAVGPEAKGAWQAAGVQTQGRIVPLGTRWDTNLFYAAADVYLDSVPFSSITSLLEAGSHGTPLLGYRLPEADLALVGPGAPGLEETMELAGDPETYRALLTRLVRDAEFRQRSGERARSEILSLHTGSKWVEAVHQLYAKVEQLDRRGCLLGNKDVFEASALNVALFQLYGRVRTRQMIGKYVGALPYRLRLPITWSLYRKGFDLCFLNLLPSPADVITRRIGRWVKRKGQRLLRFR
jgi:hypothetical protein